MVRLRNTEIIDANQKYLHFCLDRGPLLLTLQSVPGFREENLHGIIIFLLWFGLALTNTIIKYF